MCACGGGRPRSLHGRKEKHKYACMCVGYVYTYVDNVCGCTFA